MVKNDSKMNLVCFMIYLKGIIKNKELDIQFNHLQSMSERKIYNFGNF